MVDATETSPQCNWLYLGAADPVYVNKYSIQFPCLFGAQFLTGDIVTKQLYRNQFL